MRLRPYIPEKDFEAVQNWVNDERVHAMWCANLIQYPLEKNNFVFCYNIYRRILKGAGASVYSIIWQVTLE